MRSILAFAAIQIMVYIFSMSNATIISIIVLGSAVILFAGAFLSALLKDRKHRRKSAQTILELN